MCCFVLVLGLLGPRLAFLWTWIFTPKVEAAFAGGFWAPLLGLIFLPWTALAYVLVWDPAQAAVSFGTPVFTWAPIDGVAPLGWVVIALGFVLDIATYVSGGVSRSSRSA